ncbi:ATP-binding protein [Xylanimonas sp. McL0601]|uniref:ATP-binding protein n=1 Tax=Xylanimonas sp. McL0601 TaxID=3414739 RepID=UPI003CF420D4
MVTSDPASGGDLIGRHAELELLLRDAVDRPAGEAGVRVVVGSPGIGKSTLLRALADHARAAGNLVLDIVGIEAESKLPYAGLLQLLSPVLAHAHALPATQRRALLTAFELEDGPAPQPFLVALACLGLLVEASVRQPVTVVADDAHWLDAPTQEALAFAARRVEHERVAIVAAVRAGAEGAVAGGGLPTVPLHGLDGEAAAEVLARTAPDLDAAARSWVLREAEGNPLALVELPVAWRLHRGAEGDELGFVPLTSRLERAFAARTDELPRSTCDVLLAAAVDDEDGTAEILAAASVLAGRPVGVEALDAAVEAGLITYDERKVAFRHPLVRSGVVHAELPGRRQAAHAALASALGAQPYRRAWHRAQSVIGADDDVADELERSHLTALRRGSVVSAIWALERSARLTTDSAARGRRLLLAAEHAFELGRADVVDRLVAAADREALCELDRTRIQWLREIFNDGVPGDPVRVVELCRSAERAAAAGDVDLALHLLLAAGLRCWWADTGPTARAEVVAAAGRLGAAAGPDVLEDPRHLAARAVAEPVLAAGPVLGRLGQVVLENVTDPDALRLHGMAAHAVGDPVRAADFLGRSERGLRAQGRLGLLSHVLAMEAFNLLELGDWDGAAICLEEGRRVAAETGQPIWTDGTLTLSAILHAMRGEHDDAMAQAARAELSVGTRRLTNLLACVQLARGLSLLSAGQYADAYRALRRMFDPADPAFALTERFHAVGPFAEAAARSGRQSDAAAVLRALEAETAEGRAPILVPHLAYARAVLAPDDEAEPLYLQALALDLVRWPWARARIEVAYGAWLRRRRRGIECRAPLRAARTTFDLIGATSWAAQARAELRASGEHDNHPSLVTLDVLSAQELQIARLAAQGLSNREIGERLFLSPRTVGSHLYRIFPKLDITSRAQLARRLAPV